MKKIISFILGLFVAAGTVALADDFSDFQAALVKNNKLYYFCPDNGQIIYMNYENNYLNQTAYTVNFITNKCSRQWAASTWITKDYFRNTKLEFEIQNGKFLSYTKYDTDYYIRLNSTTQEQMISEVKKNSTQYFDSILGSYTDKQTKRSYTLKKNGNKYTLTATYPAENKQAVTVELTQREPVFFFDQSNNYVVSFYNGKLNIDDPTPNPNPPAKPAHDERDCGCGEDSDYNGWSVNFEIPLYSKNKIQKPERLTQTISFFFYYYDGSIKRFGWDDSEARIAQRNTSNYNFESILISKGYKLYQDNDGWKHIDFENEKFLLIDGKDQNFAFNYHAATLKDDSQALKNTFMDADKVSHITYPGTYKSLNGDYFENVKASSTLTDKYHEYAASGTMTVFNPFELKKTWVKNNLPWVEGKSGDGIDEYIEFDIKPNNWAAIQKIQLRVLPGYVDPLRPYLFKQNNRPKKLLIETDTGFSRILTLNDAVEFASIMLPKETKHVKVTIKEVYKGTKYSDTCITAFDMYYELWDK